jgi:hypothetical protein
MPWKATLTLILSLVGATHLIAGPGREERPSSNQKDAIEKPFDDARHAKWRAITAELKRGRREPWEGVFYDGSSSIGLARGWMISRKVGYVSTTRRYDWGTVEVKGDRIILVSENPGKPWGLMPLEYVVVPWGPQVYLVEPDCLVAFCNAVNSGGLGRYTPGGEFLLRVEDFDKSPTGFPRVPEEYKDYLLPKPITGSLAKTNGEKGDVAVLGLKLLRSGFSWTLDVGKKHGVRTGMKFYPAQETDREVSSSFYVIAVMEKESELLEYSFTEGAKSQGRPGMRLSTRDPSYEGVRLRK